MQDMIDRLERNLERQNKAYADTLEEIAQIEKIVPTPKSLLRMLKTKRDRQAKLAGESQDHILILKLQQQQLTLTPITEQEKNATPELGKTIIQKRPR